MIIIEEPKVYGLEATVRGMRNPMNSWGKSDSGHCNFSKRLIGPCSTCEENHTGRCYNEFILGDNDYNLMLKLAKAGPVDWKFRRMITVSLDITAPLYWWKEFDTYKVGTVANSCSTMHKIHAKEFTKDDFSHEHLDDLFDYEPEVRDLAPFIEFQTQTETETNYVVGPDDILDLTVSMLNRCRDLFLQTKDKKYWWQMIQLLPSSYNQKRTVLLNYEVLSNIYKHRKNHKLDEWRHFCEWIETLPYSDVILA